MTHREMVEGDLYPTSIEFDFFGAKIKTAQGDELREAALYGAPVSFFKPQGLVAVQYRDQLWLLEIEQVRFFRTLHRRERRAL